MGGSYDAQLFSGRNFNVTRSRWPALTNLGRWKPRGPGAVYGESVMSAIGRSSIKRWFKKCLTNVDASQVRALAATI